MQAGCRRLGTWSRIGRLDLGSFLESTRAGVVPADALRKLLAVMRILKIELPATLTSTDPDVSLASDSLRDQLRRELDALKDDFAEDVRRRATGYVPSGFTIFVRFFFNVDDNSAKVILWIDDPTVRWPSGLFARRAWRLSVPIVSHIAKETFEARVKSIGITINEKKARVASFAPTRGWLDPVILTVMVALISAGYWLVVHPWMWAWLTARR